MMLKAYVDESESGGVFVLGGYIASAENWERFTDEWQEVLDMRPRMEFLHMHEIRRWDDDIFAERLQRFYRVIEDHVSAEFSCIVDMDVVRRAVAKFPLKILGLTPYRIAFQRLIYRVMRHKGELGLTGTVDFVFDERDEEEEIREAWHGIVANSPEILSEVSRVPQFLSDKSVMPLQAADVHAWWVRRRQIENKTGAKRLMTPWQETKIIPGFVLTFEESDITNMLWSVFDMKGDVGFTYG